MEDLFKRGQADKEAARSFVDKWKDKLSKISDGSGEKQYCQEFWIDLIETFGKSRDLLDFEHKTAGNGYADVVSKDLGFIAEQKSKNVPLDKPEPRQGEEVTPFQQAFRYRADLTSDYSIRTIVTSNFEAFWFYDLMTDDGIKGIPCAKVALEEIPDNLNLFKNLFGGEEVRRQFGILNRQYTEMAAKEVAALYNVLKDDVDNPRFSEAQKKEFEEKIPLIVMRVVFLLFADNTSADIGKIFSSNQFTTFLEKSTDATHFNQDLMMLFRCLNIESEEERVDELIPEELMSFPYVDGGLFEEPVKFPSISEETFGKIRDLERKFKQWDEINISVFGPIMGDAFSPEEKREEGIHYTSRENILKVINPLFMDELRAELEEIKSIRGHEEREEKLKAFHDKLSRLQFFDPACGSGNFLTETYMELRALEDEVIALENSVHDLDKDVKVSLSQFHGIEIEEYSAMVARTALQIASEQALERSYERFKDSVSVPPHFLPLKNEATGIVCDNALEMDWGELVKPSESLFIFGNPPYKGQSGKRGEKSMSSQQREELKAVFEGVSNAGSLDDYCAAWYYKTAKFLDQSGGVFALLSTNSVTQGIQVEPLFEPIFHMGWRISFAWPSFKWDLDAEVAVVIIGMSQNLEGGLATLFLGTTEEGKYISQKVSNISPFNLKAFPTVFIKTDSPIRSTNLPEFHLGSRPLDNGWLILKNKEELLEAQKDPIAKKYIKSYVGPEKNRWILWLKGSQENERKESKILKDRLSKISEFRKNSSTNKDSWEFGIKPPQLQFECDYLAVPKYSQQEKFKYFLAQYFPKGTIASDGYFICNDPTKLAFPIVESSMFFAWTNLLVGRMGNNKRFNSTIAWDTFPLPALTNNQKDRIIEAGAKVLEARAQTDASLADLYDPENMSSDLRKAHEALDKAVDLVFAGKPLKSEEERQKVLLKAYEEMTRKNDKTN